MAEKAKLPPLNLPTFDMRITSDGENVRIYDSLRHKNVALTPEEYVRQHFVNYLQNYLHYPASMMANEMKIELNDTVRRCDTVVFSLGGKPLMIVEYKAPSVNITQDVFDQIVRYNMVLKAKYLIVSNGFRHYCCVIDYASDTYHFIAQIPEYKHIASDFSAN